MTCQFKEELVMILPPNYVVSLTKVKINVDLPVWLDKWTIYFSAAHINIYLLKTENYRKFMNWELNERRKSDCCFPFHAHHFFLGRKEEIRENKKAKEHRRVARNCAESRINLKLSCWSTVWKEKKNISSTNRLKFTSLSCVLLFSKLRFFIFHLMLLNLISNTAMGWYCL